MAQNESTAEVGAPFVDDAYMGMERPAVDPPASSENVPYTDTDFAEMPKGTATPEPSAAPVEYVGEIAATPPRHWRVSCGASFGCVIAPSAEEAVQVFHERLYEIPDDMLPHVQVEELTGRRNWHVRLDGIGDLQNIKADDEPGAIAEFNRICGVSQNGGFAECKGAQTDSPHCVEEMA